MSKTLTLDDLRRTPFGASLVSQLENEEQRLAEREAKAKAVAELKKRLETAKKVLSEKQKEAKAACDASEKAHIALVAKVSADGASAYAMAHSLDRQIDSAMVFLRDSASPRIAEYQRELRDEADEVQRLANSTTGFVTNRGIDLRAIERRGALLRAVEEVDSLRYAALDENEIEKKLDAIRARLAK